MDPVRNNDLGTSLLLRKTGMRTGLLSQNKDLMSGLLLTAGFAVWTYLITHVDVRPVGINGTAVGFAAFNTRIHQMTGVHMTLYTVTDWLGLVPIGVCLFFAALGFRQLLHRKDLFKVDADILLLGLLYLLLIATYLLFEMYPINYRPVLIDGFMEASYPSSTTLLVTGVMPTLSFQADRRSKDPKIKKAVTRFVTAFTIGMVTGRLLSGVHWATDIAGSLFLGPGLFHLYRAAVSFAERKLSSARIFQ